MCCLHALTYAPAVAKDDMRGAASGRACTKTLANGFAWGGSREGPVRPVLGEKVKGGLHAESLVDLKQGAWLEPGGLERWAAAEPEGVRLGAALLAGPEGLAPQAGLLAG